MDLKTNINVFGGTFLGEIKVLICCVLTILILALYIPFSLIKIIFGYPIEFFIGKVFK